jgi:hypothetical protein
LTAIRAAAAASVLLFAAAIAHAQEIKAGASSVSSDTSAEVGLEVDSNVSRVETGVSPPVQAVLARLGARFQIASRAVAGGAAAIAGMAQLRNALGSDVTSENLSVLGVDGQWLVPIRAGELRLGPQLVYRDALATFGSTSDRTFRAGSVDLALVLPGEASRVTVSLGPHGFEYKPNGKYSWLGVGGALRVDVPLWRGGDADERALDLTLIATVEQRAYRSIAFLNVCTPEEPLTAGCFVATPRPRGDRVHRASVALGYTGAVVATGEAQLTAVDSNSFGRSWIGGRLRGAVTMAFGEVYATATASLQLDRYTDGLLVARDPELGLFDALTDDSRSSVELRLGIPISGRWSLEARAAAWTDLSTHFRYQRQLGYVGVVWGR